MSLQGTPGNNTPRQAGSPLAARPGSNIPALNPVSSPLRASAPGSVQGGSNRASWTSFRALSAASSSRSSRVDAPPVLTDADLRAAQSRSTGQIVVQAASSTDVASKIYRDALRSLQTLFIEKRILCFVNGESIFLVNEDYSALSNLRKYVDANQALIEEIELCFLYPKSFMTSLQLEPGKSIEIRGSSSGRPSLSLFWQNANDDRLQIAYYPSTGVPSGEKIKWVRLRALNYADTYLRGGLDARESDPNFYKGTECGPVPYYTYYIQTCLTNYERIKGQVGAEERDQGGLADVFRKQQQKYMDYIIAMSEEVTFEWDLPDEGKKLFLDTTGKKWDVAVPPKRRGGH